MKTSSKENGQEFADKSENSALNQSESVIGIGNMNNPTRLFEWLISYEIEASKRYRRFFSILMVACMDQSINLKDLLNSTFRDSDKIINLNSNNSEVIVMMGETNEAGARSAIDRLRSMCGTEIALEIATAYFPSDATDMKNITCTIRKRMKDVSQSLFGENIENDVQNKELII